MNFDERLLAVRDQVLSKKAETATLVADAKNSFLPSSQLADADLFRQTAQDVDTDLFREVTPGSTEIFKEVGEEATSLKANSPIVSQEGPISLHEDGTYSVTTAEGVFIPGLTELNAREFAGYNQENARAVKAGAPTDFLGTKANAIVQTTIDLGAQAASAFTTDPENLKAIKDFSANLKTKVPVNRKEQVAAHTAFTTIAKNSGNWEATKNALFNDLGTLISQGIDSVPYMVAFTIGGPVAQTAILTSLAIGKGNQAIEEFTEKNGRRPTEKEATRIKLWSAVGTVAEKYGDMAAVKAIPGRLAWIKQVQKTVKEVTPPSILSLTVLRPARGLAGEGLSGGITSATEQLAAEGEITDTAAITYDALAEAAGTPGGVATIVAGLTGVHASIKLTERLADAAISPSSKTKIKESIEKEIAGIKAILAGQETIKFGNTEEGDKYIKKLAEIEVTLAAANIDIDGNFDKEKADTENAIFNGMYMAYKEANPLSSNEEANVETRKQLRKEIAALEAHKKEVTEKLDTPLSGDETVDHIKELEDTKVFLEGLLEKGDFSDKTITKDLKDAKETIKPSKENTEIEDDEFNTIIKDANKSTTQKTIESLTKVSKRVLSASQKAALVISNNKLIKKLTDKVGTVLDVVDKVSFFGSIGPTIAEIQTAIDTAKNDHDRVLLQAQLDALKIEEQLDTKSVDKTMAEVHDEVEEGTSQRWRGIKSYQDEILDIINSDMHYQLAQQKITVLEQRLKVHADNLQNKADKFAEAHKLALADPQGRSIRVVSRSDKKARGERAVRYEIPKGDDKYVTEKNKKAPFTTIIHKKSNTLITVVTKEASYGQLTTQVVKGHKTTSFHKNAQQLKRDKANAAAQLAKAKSIEGNIKTVADPATQKDINKLKNPEGKTSPKADPVEASAQPEPTQGSDKTTKSDVFHSNSPGVKRAFDIFDIEKLQEQIKRLEKILANPETIKANSEHTAAERIAQAKLNLEAAKIQLEYLQEGQEKGLASPESIRFIVVKTDQLKAQLAKLKSGTKAHTAKAAELKEANDALTALIDKDVETELDLKEEENAKKSKTGTTGQAPGSGKETSSTTVPPKRSGQNRNNERGKPQAAPTKKKKVPSDSPIKVGDKVQWTLRGVDQFKEPTTVLKIYPLTPDGFTYVKLEGTNTGALITELTVVDSTKQTIPKTFEFTKDESFALADPENGYSPEDIQRLLDDPVFAAEALAEAKPTPLTAEEQAAEDLEREENDDFGITEDFADGGDTVKIVAALERLQASRQAPSTNKLTKTLLKGFKTTDVALQWLIDNAVNPEFKGVAKQLLGTVGKLEVRFSEKRPDSALGSTIVTVDGVEVQRDIEPTGTSTSVTEFIGIVIYANALDNKVLTTEEVLLHELIHVAVRNTFTNPITKAQKAAVKELHKINSLLRVEFDAIEHGGRDPERAFGGKLTKKEINILEKLVNQTPEEFITYGLTNKLYQNILKKLPPQYEYGETPKNKPSSLWSQFVSVVRIVLNIPEHQHTLLTQILEASSDLILIADVIIPSNESFEDVDLDAIFGAEGNFGDFENEFAGESAEEQTPKEFLEADANREQTAEIEEIDDLAPSDVTDRFIPIEELSKQALYLVFPEVITRNGKLKIKEQANLTGPQRKQFGLILNQLASLFDLDVIKNRKKDFPALLDALKDLGDTKNFIEVTKDTLPIVITDEQLTENKTKALPGRKRAAQKKGEKAPTLEELKADSGDSALGILSKKFAELVQVRVNKKGKEATGIFALPDVVFKSDAMLQRALITLGLSRPAAVQMTIEYNRFAKKYQDIKLTETFSTGIPAARKPLSLLHRGEEGLPPQIIFAMAIGSMQMISRNPTNIAFRSGFAKSEFLYNTYTDLTGEESEQLDEVGSGYNNTAESTGKSIAALLKITSVDVETSGYFDHLEIALGLAAIQIEHGPSTKLNKLTFEERSKLPDSRYHVASHIWNFKQVPYNADRKFNSKITQEIADELNKDVTKPKNLKYHSQTTYPTVASLQAVMQQLRNKLSKDKTALKAIMADMAILRAELNYRSKTVGLRDATEYKHIQIHTPRVTTISEDGTKEHKETPFEFSDKEAAALKETEEAFGIQSHNKFPLQKPSKNIVTEVRNSNGKVPEEVTETLTGMHNNAWTKAQAMDMLSLVAEIPGLRAVIDTLAGVVKIHKRAHEAVKLSDSASNANKTIALDEVLEANKPENNKLEKFFFTYRLQNQLRILMDGNINPQQSKVTRQLLRSDDKVTVYTKDNIHLFKQSVASHLGVKIDKQNLAASEAEFDTIVNDPHVQRAVIILANLGKNPKKDKKLKTLLPKIQNKFGGDISIFAALVALTNYMPDGKPPTEVSESFSSDTLLEIDGISSGFAQNVGQFPNLYGEEFNEQVQNQVGIYKGKEGDEIHHNTDALDIYHTLVEKVIEGEDADIAAEYARKRNQFFNEDAYKNKDTALKAIYKQLRDENSRDLVKYPFLIFMYGGGIKSISEGVAKLIVGEIYQQLSALNIKYQDLVEDKTLTEAQKAPLLVAEIKKIRKLADHLETIGAFKFNKGKTDRFQSRDDFVRSIVKGTSQTKYLNDSFLITNVGEVLAPRFHHGLTGMLGGTQQARDAVIQSGEILHAAFMVHFEKAYAEKLGKRSSLSKKEIDALIEEQLLDVFPQYKGPLMTKEERAFVDLTKRALSQAISNEEVSKFAFTNEKGTPSDVGGSPRQSVFVSPGVSALIRLIINMDSAILTKVLAKFPNALALHDAIMANPSILEDVSNEYGNVFNELHKNHSILQTISDQVDTVIKITEAKDKANDNRALMQALNTWLITEGHQNQFARKTEDIQDLNAFRANIAEALAIVTEGRAERQKEVSKAGGKVFNHQLFLARKESKKAKKNTKPKVKKKKVTLETELEKKVVISVKRAKRPKMTETIDIIVTPTDSDTIPSVLHGGKDVPAIILGNFAVHKGQPDSGKNKDIFGKGKTSQVTHIPSGVVVVRNLTAQKAYEWAYDFSALLAEANIDTAGIKTRKDIDRVTPIWRFARNALMADDVDTAKREFLKEHSTTDPDSLNQFASLDNLKRDNEVTIMNKDVNGSNLISLFDTFAEFSANYYASTEDMNAHTLVLNRIMNMLAKGMDATTQINLTVEEIDGITQGNYDLARDAVRLSLSRQPPVSANGQSPQEVYTHEMVHAMVAAALASEPLLARRVEQLYNQTLHEIGPVSKGHLIFLEGITNPSAEDVIAAKRQYNYLFDNPTKEANRLHEFLAYAVTNKSLIKYLSGTNIKLPVRNKGLLGKLLHLVDLIVDEFKALINRKFHKRQGRANSFEEMIAVTEQLIAIQSKHESILRKEITKIYTHLSDTDQKIRNYAEEQGLKLIQLESVGIFKQVVSDLASVGALTMSDSASAHNARQHMFLTLNKTLRSIANEVGRGSLSKIMIDRLLHAKVNISKARQEAERFTTNWFNGIWKTVKPSDPHGMTVDMREALTDVLLRADISSLKLIGLSSRAIVRLIGADRISRQAILKEQAAILTKLNIARSHRAIKYADELGYHISTGNTKLHGAYQNAYSLAIGELDNPTAEQVQLLDAYASLAALNYADPRKLEQVKTLANNEMEANSKDNGIVDMIDSHLLFKRNSLEHLFKSNPTQMVKGYIIERVDNFTSMRTGFSTQEKQMSKEGYTEAYSLGEILGIPQAHDTLYITRTTPEVPDASGVVSTTNQRNMGTTLTEILAKHKGFQDSNGNPDFFKIERKVAAFHQTQLAEGKVLIENKKIKLRPLRDDQNKIVDYRVMMGNETKKQLLRPDLEIQNVFAHMHSVYIDRKNTIDNDLEVVKLLVHEQSDMHKSHPDIFIDFINDPNYVDRFRKLPKEVRDYMKSFAVNGKFMVREDIVDKVFGYKVWDFSQFKFLQGESMGRVKRYVGIFHYILRQIVGYGKDRIVVAMPKVVFGNMISNIAQLSMRNIPITFTIRKILEGFHEYQRYRKDTDARTSLLHRIGSKQLGANSPEAIKAEQLKVRIENNKIHRMTAAGLNSLIVEDVNEAQIDGFFNRIKRTLKVDKTFSEFADRVPNSVSETAAIMFMTKTSAPYQLARQMVQLTDFLGRYVMIEHLTTVENKDFEVAMHESLDAFVLFDEALTPALEAIDAVGATSFISYFMRNQRAARRLAQTNPTGVGLSAAIQGLTGIPTLGNVNAAWLSGDISPNMLQFDDLLDEANNVSLLEALKDIFG